MERNIPQCFISKNKLMEINENNYLFSNKKFVCELISNEKNKIKCMLQ